MTLKMTLEVTLEGTVFYEACVAVQLYSSVHDEGDEDDDRIARELAKNEVD